MWIQLPRRPHHLFAKPSKYTKIMKTEVVLQMPGKMCVGNPAAQAFCEGQPKTWEAGASEEEALNRLARTLHVNPRDFTVERSCNETMRRRSRWEDLPNRKAEFGMART